jgi:hypothetical protein
MLNLMYAMAMFDVYFFYDAYDQFTTAYYYTGSQKWEIV